MNKDIIIKANEFLYNHLQKCDTDQKSKIYRYEHSLEQLNFTVLQ